MRPYCSWLSVLCFCGLAAATADAADLTPPSAPPGVPIERGQYADDDYDADGEITPFWYAATDAESGIVAYQLQERTGAGSWVTVNSAISGQFFRVSGRVHNSLYSYRVRARNGAGLWGPWSLPSDGILVDKTLASAVIVTAEGTTSATTSHIRARWTASSDPESGVVRYYIQLRQGIASGPIVRIAGTYAPTTEVTFDDLPLAPGARYYLVVVPVSGTGAYGYAAVSDGITIVNNGMPTSPSVVRTSGRQLLVQRRQPDGTLAPATPYIIKAVNWSPASRTTNTWAQDLNNVSARRPEFGKSYLTDISLLAAMNVNTVRLFMDPGLPGDPDVTLPGLAVLDELYRNGIMVIMTVDNGNNSVDRIQPVVQYYKNHPAILMWSLGSEWNINRFWKPSQFPTVASAAQAIESAARLVKSLDSLHPVVSSYGNIDEKPDNIEMIVTQICPTIDVWSFNEYTGPGFSRLFDKWAFISGKPMFLGEFGIDAFNSTTLQEDQATHAQWTGQLWDEIARNLSATDPNKVALGGAVFAFNDEWWKAGSQFQQDTLVGWSPIAFPDLAASEDWWGIVTLDRVVRQLYWTLLNKFAPSYQPAAAPRTVTFKAESSEAYPYWGRLWENGALMYQGRGAIDNGGRGFNIAGIDLATGRLRTPIQRFDTWWDHYTHTTMNLDAMVTYLDSVPVGTLLLISAVDEAGLNNWSSCSLLPNPGVTAVITRLEALGSRKIRQMCYSDNWTLISVKGQGAALGESLGRGIDAVVTATVQMP